MIILNDFKLFRSTHSVEPFCFRAFRLILIILLFIAVLSYFIHYLQRVRYDFNYSDLSISASNPPSLIFPELKISNITCNAPVDNLTESCNDNINYTSNGCWAFSPFNFSERIKFYEEKLQCDDSLCNIRMLNNSYKAIILNITLNVSSSTDHLAVRFNFAFPEMNTKIPPRLRFNMNPFNKGQLIIFKFSTTIRRKHSSLLAKTFGFEPDLVEAFIDTETKELQQTSNSSYTTLVLQPKDNITYYEDYISHYSSKGIVQKYACCWNLRENYIRRLMKRYVSKAGIPLVENPSKLPPNATVENRIATLETLLREFFLDDSSLVTLKEIRTRCVRYQDKNNALGGDNLLRDDIVVNVNENDTLMKDGIPQ
ncbi:21213_t:CDS:2 [Dentiscutata erythropus]|uniref:21213_t:CDS:1 n=1 Tax=Dentiscutata erythropus TaxID=1348616 RepID=A0A9N9GW09_9GLOM|nr:21213_t:CDS:2 [Dentiscutata erythropus]